MRAIKTLFQLIFILIVITSAHSQNIYYYEEETIYLKTNYSYIKNGQEFHNGFFGKNLKNEMVIDFEAMTYFEKYQRQRKVSLVLIVVSLSGILIAPSIENKDIRSGLLGLASVSYIIKLEINKMSTKNINKAIWLRNGKSLRQ